MSRRMSFCAIAGCVLALTGFGVVQGQAALQSVDATHFVGEGLCRVDFADLGFPHPGANNRAATRDEVNAGLVQQSSCVHVVAGELYCRSSYLTHWAVLEPEGGATAGEVRLSFVQPRTGNRTGVTAVGMPLSEMENVKVSVTAFGKDGETLYTGVDQVFPPGKRDYGYCGTASSASDPGIWEIKLVFAPVTPSRPMTGFVGEWAPYGPNYGYDIIVETSDSSDCQQQLAQLKQENQALKEQLHNLSLKLFVAEEELDSTKAELNGLLQTLQREEVRIVQLPSNSYVAYDFTQRPRYLVVFSTHTSNCAAGFWPRGTWSPGAHWVSDTNIRYVVAVHDVNNNPSPHCQTIHKREIPQYHPIPASVLDEFFRPGGPGGFSLSVDGGAVCILVVGDSAGIPFGN
ncbi:MAG: hypothetical protein JXA57_10955 [Armatimonadetes bacterium]|nr:hypothetical protein [Armatimonadota bacterium]